RHDSISAGIGAIEAIARGRGLKVVASEDPLVFSTESLRRFRAIVLLSSTTKPKDPASEWLVGDRRTALQQFVGRGGGILAVHAAADSHYHSAWHAKPSGGRLARHPRGTPNGRLAIVDRSPPATTGPPPTVGRLDEWYYFDDFAPT